jgi:hypothetical protein
VNEKDTTAYVQYIRAPDDGYNYSRTCILFSDVVVSMYIVELERCSVRSLVIGKVELVQ